MKNNKLSDSETIEDSENISTTNNQASKWIDNSGDEVNKVFGFNASAELVNGRAAMVGFFMLILTELVFHGRPVTSAIFGINWIVVKENNKFKVFLYISVWVILWGSIASLIDLPFLKNGIYSEGDLGQYLTFSLTAMISIISAKNIFGKINLRYFCTFLFG